MSKRNMLTMMQVVAVADLLRTAYNPGAGRDQGQYREGWSDDRVAAEVGFKCTTANVAGVRTQLFGSIKKPEPIKDLDRLVRDHSILLARLEERIAFLEHQLGVVRKSGDI